MIAMGSSAALKNLMAARPIGMDSSLSEMSVGAMSPLSDGGFGLALNLHHQQQVPRLQARKLKVSADSVSNQNLSETCENLDQPSPTTNASPLDKMIFFQSQTWKAQIPAQMHKMFMPRSDSKDSVQSIHSTHSETYCEQRWQRHQANEVARSQEPVETVLNNNNMSETEFATRVSEISQNFTKKDEDKNQNPHKTEKKDENQKYAETDLDNPEFPVDYSLIYAEEDEERNFKKSQTGKESKGSVYYDSPSIHDDAVRTYAEEGTPYSQTPYLVSSAASLTDLSAAGDDKETRTVERGKFKIIVTSNKHSGRSSPDRPRTYCVEGTPLQFSHASSLSSISGAVNESEKAGCRSSVGATVADHQLLSETSDLGTSDSAATLTLTADDEDADERSTTPTKGGSGGGKTVTFSTKEEETPMMFSRSSSFDSLSSTDQQSIRSSVVSDFSRRTSGVVSPSELPDSPGGTMPPSPRTRNKTNRRSGEFDERKPRVRISSGGANTGNGQKERTKSEENGMLFEDETRSYAVEGTPCVQSHSTSLSSLTNFDDDEEMNAAEKQLLDSCMESALPKAKPKP
jgi:adenomatosis polyposis coli protein